MPTLPGKPASAAPGMQGFDTASQVSAAAARAFRLSGFRYCVRYPCRAARRRPTAASTATRSTGG